MVSKLVLTTLVAGVMASSPARQVSTQSEFGSFEGTVKTEWIDRDRMMRLLDDFVYVDRSGNRWVAHRGMTFDGASIPRILWSVVGSPFTGPYRDAAVVHDAACEQQNKPWLEVHRMFYSACRCRGVAEPMAKIMYGAVYALGPRWAVPSLTKMSTKEEEAFLKKLRSYVERENPTLEDIEEFVRGEPTRFPRP